MGIPHVGFKGRQTDLIVFRFLRKFYSKENLVVRFVQFLVCLFFFWPVFFSPVFIIDG